MNKKIISIISGIIIILSGAGIITFNISNEDSYENSSDENTNSTNITTDKSVTETTTKNNLVYSNGVFITTNDKIVAESPTEIATEPITEIITESTTEIVTEPITEIIIESTTEIVTEPITEVITEPITDIVYDETTEIFTDNNNYVEYHFRNQKLLNQHFEKHGGEFSEFNYLTAQDYEKGASNVINNPNALFKTEAEDGDGVYYIEQSNEIVILSTDGYIRTYFRPSSGINYFYRT